MHCITKHIFITKAPLKSGWMGVRGGNFAYLRIRLLLFDWKVQISCTSTTSHRSKFF